MVRKGHLRAQQEGTFYKPEREPSPAAEPTNTLILAIYASVVSDSLSMVFYYGH